MKWIATIITAVGILALTGCNSGESKPSSTDTNTPAAQMSTPEEVVDAAKTAEASAQSAAKAAVEAAPTAAQN